MRDRQAGGFHWVLDPQGQVDPRLGDEKHVYGTAFALYAASTVYEVTRDDLALKVARDAFDWLEAHAHDGEHGGYFEALTPGRDADPRLGRARPAREADRPAGRLLRLQVDERRTSTCWRPWPSSPGSRRRRSSRNGCREVHAVVRDRIAVEPGALNLYLTRDWRATPAHDSFGHDVETAYLLVEAAEALGDARRPADLAHGPAAGRPRPGLGLGRRARRLLRQGRRLRRRGVRHARRSGGRRPRGSTPCC